MKNFIDRYDFTIHSRTQKDAINKDFDSQFPYIERRDAIKILFEKELMAV